jgi:regulator of sigma E protease
MYLTMNSVIAFLVLIGVLIFVHELGHFMWAKILGVKVLTFSLGFPPKLLARTFGETEYVISAIPLGGYVKMLGEDAGEDVPESDMRRAFHMQPVWKRFVIVFAGPFMNLIFPIFIYVIVLSSIGTLRPATVGTLVPGDPADEAGLRPGDRIVEIDGKAIYGFEDLKDVVSGAAGRSVPIAFVRDGERLEAAITPRKATETVVPILDLKQEVGRIGVYPAFPRPVIEITDPGGAAARAGLRSRDLVTSVDGRRAKRWLDVERMLARPGPAEVEVAYLRPVPIETPAGTVYTYEPGTATLSFDAKATLIEGLGAGSSECFVSEVREGTPAYLAGLREGDRILSLNGQEVRIWDQLTNTLRTYPDDEHSITYERPDGVVVSSSFRQARETQKDEFGQEHTRYTFGARNFNLYTEDDWVPNPNRFSRAVRGALEGTWYYIKITGILFARLVQGKVSLRTIGGPILIFDIAGRSAKEGATTFLDTMALISINLGLINLVPIPILDGGVILLMVIEAVRRQRLSDRFKVVYQYVGMGIVGVLVVLVFYNDISRYWDRIVGFFTGS